MIFRSRPPAALPPKRAALCAGAGSYSSLSTPIIQFCILIIPAAAGLSSRNFPRRAETRRGFQAYRSKRRRSAASRPGGSEAPPLLTDIGSAGPCIYPRRTKTSPGCETRWAGNPPPRGRRRCGLRYRPIRARIRCFLWFPFGELPSSRLRRPPPRTQFPAKPSPPIS